MNRCTSVQADTGALSIYLTHFCRLTCKPKVTDYRGSDRLFRFLIEEEDRFRDSSLYIASSFSLDAIIAPLKDHLFILHQDVLTQVYLILRELDSPNTYRVTATGKCVLLDKGLGIITSEIPPITSVASAFQDMRTIPNHNIDHKRMRDLPLFFSGAKTGWDTLPACRSVFQDQDSNFSLLLLASYLSCIPPCFNPRISTGFVEISIALKDGPHKVHKFESSYSLINECQDNSKLLAGS